MCASAPSTLHHVAFAVCLGLLVIGTSLAGARAQSDPLPSWNEGAAKKPELTKLPKIEFVDDGPCKPVGLNRFIGRRRILAFGNSDGDLQMLQWTGSGARFAGIVHHNDAAHEYAYDRPSKIGQLDKALVEAKAKGWTVVDMNQEWKKVFAFEP